VGKNASIFSQLRHAFPGLLGVKYGPLLVDFLLGNQLLVFLFGPGEHLEGGHSPAHRVSNTVINPN